MNQTNQPPFGRRILGVREVCAKTSLSRTTLWRLGRDRESGFPAAVTLSPGRVGWDADAVEAWLAVRLGDQVAA
jgi:predicted DNA-binding transcriptional regulator AlpA